jgi:hypothetical protein
MENILINKENKNRLTSKYKYILSTLFVFLSLYMTSPKAPEQIVNAKGDVLVRSLIRHDPIILSKLIEKILNESI